MDGGVLIKIDALNLAEVYHMHFFSYFVKSKQPIKIYTTEFLWHNLIDSCLYWSGIISKEIDSASLVTVGLQREQDLWFSQRHLV